MLSSISVEKVISDLEIKYDLFSWKIENIFVWELVRVPIYLELLSRKNNDSFEKNDISTSLGKYKIIFNRIFQNLLLRNPFLLKKTDVVVLESGRKYLFDGDYIDFYTYFFEEKLKKEKASYEYFETNFKYDSYGVNNRRNYHLDFIKFASKFCEKFVKIRIFEYDIEKIKKIEDEIENELNIKINLKDIFLQALKVFKIQKFWYSKLLKLKNIKKVYFVNYVDYFPLIAACKENSVITAEFQHGLIIKESLIYHFSNVKLGSLHYFPDYFYAWRGFKFNSGQLPIDSSHIIENKFNHLNFNYNKFKTVVKEEKSILVASQPFFSDSILKYIIFNAKLLPDYKFYYKLHPMEFDNFMQSRNAEILKSLNNVEIYKNEISSYELLSKCKYIIGIYSTMLYEAHIFGTIPLILSIKDSTYANSLIKNNNNVIMIDENSPLSLILN